MLTFGQLQTLRAIAETGSFSKAARKLYLSQPDVSQRVHSIEVTLGVELFEQSGAQQSPWAMMREGFVVADLGRKINSLADPAVLERDGLPRCSRKTSFSCPCSASCSACRK